MSLRHPSPQSRSSTPHQTALSWFKLPPAPHIDRLAPSFLPGTVFKPPKAKPFPTRAGNFFLLPQRSEAGDRGGRAARPHLAAALQVPSGAVVPPRTRRGRRAHGSSLPPARRSRSEGPSRARSRLEPPFGPSPVLSEALPPPREPTRGARGSGVAPTRPRRALRLRGVRSRGEGAAPAAPAAPRFRLSARSGPLGLRPVLVLLFCFLCLYPDFLSFFFPSPLLSVILFFRKADPRRSKWEKVLSLSRTLPLPAGGGRGCGSLRLLLPRALLLLPGRRGRCDAQAACWRPKPARSAHAQLPRCRLALRPAPQRPRPGSPAPGGRGNSGAGELRVLPAGLAEGGRLTRQAQPHVSPLVPLVLRAFIGHLVLLCVS